MANRDRGNPEMDRLISVEVAEILKAEAEEHLKKMLVYQWLSAEAFLSDQACGQLGIRFQGVTIDEESQEFLFVFAHKKAHFARRVAIGSLMNFDPDIQAPENSSEEDIIRNLRKSAKRMRLFILAEMISTPFKALGRILDRIDGFVEKVLPEDRSGRPLG